jgi:hypothetical protein
VALQRCGAAGWASSTGTGVRRHLHHLTVLPVGRSRAAAPRQAAGPEGSPVLELLGDSAGPSRAPQDSGWRVLDGGRRC